MRHAPAGLLALVATLVVGCASEAPPDLEGDCLARIRVGGSVLEPRGEEPTGRRGPSEPVEVVGCEEEAVGELRARPVRRDGELLGYVVTRGDYRGYYSTDGLVEPAG